MNDIKFACEHFEKLLREQFARLQSMDKPVKDFSKMETVTIGIAPGDGIGPIIMEQALRVFEKLLQEDIAAGKTSYEQGRTIIYAIAQGKDAGTAQNYTAGWAHNFAIPLELWLSDDGKEVIREPIKEIESLREETLYSYSGEGKTAAEINSEISGIRGDLLEIRAKVQLNPTGPEYSAGLCLRYNPNVFLL